jgi:excisionase family DNA binding protein
VRSRVRPESAGQSRFGISRAEDFDGVHPRYTQSRPRQRASKISFPNSGGHTLRTPAITPECEGIIMNKLPITVSVREAQELVGLSRTTLYALINAKRLTVVKVNRRTLITTDSLLALVTPA